MWGRADPAQQVWVQNSQAVNFWGQACDTDAQNCGVWTRHSHTVLIDPYDQVSADGIRKTPPPTSLQV